MIKNLSAEILARLHGRFNRLYGSRQADRCTERLAAMVGRYGIGYEHLRETPKWDESRIVLITYADMIRAEEEVPLAVLKRFCDHHLHGAIDTVHLLPFFPYSSDDGFSVIDYREVDPSVGQWKHVQSLGRNFNLMFDLVLNHVSRKSDWFINYAAGIAPFRNYFIEVDPKTDLSAVVRPRSSPVLTPVHKDSDKAWVWTTFSEDQIDLDFANADVLFEFIDILFFYLYMGARIIRLDAIAYLWKKIGSSCIHLPQTHEIVKLLRNLLDMIAPDAILLTETNVPHEENISYFGDGDEAHMVYQFSLPPLLLHALTTGNGRYLTQWAKTVSDCPEGCTFFNFTASHDGIGIRPLAGLIPDEEFAALIETMKARGTHVSTKRDADGNDSPYEINISYFDALGGDRLQVERFLCSQMIMLGLRGVPGIYFHSLTATPNDNAGVEATGRARSINRRKWNETELADALADSKSATARIFNEYRRRLKIRAQHAVFHPDACQRVIDLGPEFFAFIRTSIKGHEITACISNLTGKHREITIDSRFPECDTPRPCIDLLSGTRYSGSGKTVSLEPYQTVWLATS